MLKLPDIPANLNGSERTVVLESRTHIQTILQTFEAAERGTQAAADPKSQDLVELYGCVIRLAESTRPTDESCLRAVERWIQKSIVTDTSGFVVRDGSLPELRIGKIGSKDSSGDVVLAAAAVNQIPQTRTGARVRHALLTPDS